MANVFISHRGDASVEAEQLASDIQKAGHKVWIDLWEVNLGDSIIEKINEGLEGSSYVVLCYSSSGIDAPWISREWSSTLARQLEGHQVKILPAFISKGKVPAILADLQYADLTKDWNEGLNKILKAIR